MGDELGGYDFGYSGGPSSRAETRDHLGIVRGAYTSLGAGGDLQSTQYVSDALGYRVLNGAQSSTRNANTYNFGAGVPLVGGSCSGGPSSGGSGCEVRCSGS